jgi:hypothetical protein
MKGRSYGCCRGLVCVLPRHERSANICQKENARAVRGRSGTGAIELVDYGQPPANLVRKQEKSATLWTGGVVDPSQFA